MSVERTIKVEEIVADLLSGMEDRDLMVKYRITAPELVSLLGYLVDSGLARSSTSNRRVSG